MSYSIPTLPLAIELETVLKKAASTCYIFMDRVKVRPYWKRRYEEMGENQTRRKFSKQFKLMK